MKFFSLFLISTCFAVLSSYSQYKFDWTKYDSLSFKEDSVLPFQNQYSQVEKIGSIKNSDSQIELRYYFTKRGDAAFLYQVKYNDQKIERFVYFIGNYKVNEKVKNAEFTGKIGNSDIYRRAVNDIKYPEDSLFLAIYDHQLLTIPDQERLIDSLRKQKIELFDRNHNPDGIRCSDCPIGFNLVELKIGNKARNFMISQQAWSYYYFNPGYDIFKDYADLDKLLADYFAAFNYAYLYGWKSE